MPLTPKQEKILKQHFQGLKIHPACPLCGKSQWDANGIAAIPFLDLTKLGLDKTFNLPTVAMVCEQCGYTIQISAKKLGFV